MNNSTNIMSFNCALLPIYEKDYLHRYNKVRSLIKYIDNNEISVAILQEVYTISYGPITHFLKKFYWLMNDYMKYIFYIISILEAKLLWKKSSFNIFDNICLDNYDIHISENKDCAKYTNSGLIVICKKKYKVDFIDYFDQNIDLGHRNYAKITDSEQNLSIYGVHLASTSGGTRKELKNNNYANLDDEVYKKFKEIRSKQLKQMIDSFDNKMKYIVVGDYNINLNLNLDKKELNRFPNLFQIYCSENDTYKGNDEYAAEKLDFFVSNLQLSVQTDETLDWSDHYPIIGTII